MPAYGKVKVDTITHDVSGTAVDLSVANIATKASPTFTGTVTVPTPSADDNSTKAASTAYVQTELGDYALKAGPTFTGTVNAADLVLSGDLTVNGTTTTINTQTLDVEDKNIVIGKVSTPTDTTADGGGITLKGSSDHTFNWVNATDAWTSSEHIALAAGKNLITAGDFHITGDSTNSIQLRVVPNEKNLVAVANGAVELYHDNSKKIETTSSGVTVTGTLAATAVTGDGSGLSNLPPGGNTFTAVANGAIANNKAVKIDADGKVSQIAESFTPRNQWYLPESVQISTDNDSRECTNVWVGGSHRLVVNVWQDTSGNIKARSYYYNSSWSRQDGTAQTIVSGNTDKVTVSYDPVEDRLLFVYIQNVSGNYELRATVATPDGTNRNLTSIQSAVTIETASGNSNANPSVFYETTSQKHIVIYRTNPSGGVPGANWDCKYRVMSLSGNTLTTNSSNTFDVDDSTRFNFCRTGANTIAVAYRAGDGTGYVRAGTIGSTTITWGSRVDFTNDGSAQISYGNRGTIGCAFDIANSKLCIVYVHAGNKRPRAVYASISTNTVTIENAGYNQEIGVGSNGNDDVWVHAIYEPLAGKIWTIMNQYRSAYGQYTIYSRRIDYISGGSMSLYTLTLGDTQWDQDVSWNAAVGEDGYIFPTALDRSSTNYHYFYRALLTYQNSTLTDANHYVGFADAAYTNGQTATIKTYGNTVDTLSGLTAGTLYYLQLDGSVGTSSNFTSFATNTPLAGTALSATKLLIRDPLAKT